MTSMGGMAVQRIFAIITVPVLLLVAFGLLAMNWSRDRDIATTGTSGDQVKLADETDGAAKKYTSQATSDSAKKTTGKVEQEPAETLPEKFSRLLAEEMERKSAGASRSKSQMPGDSSSPASDDEPTGGVALEPPANLPANTSDSIAPLTPPVASSQEATEKRRSLGTQTRLVRVPDDLDDLEPDVVVGQLIITGDQITNRSLKNLNGRRILSLSIEAVNVTNAGLIHLPKVNNLRELRIWAPGVDDDGLEVLAKIQHLERLDLEGTNVQGVGLASAAGLQRLQSLTLGPKMQEQQLHRLQAFPSLEELDLRSCRQLTDACVESLGLLKNLRLLWLPKQLSESSRKSIRQTLAECQIRM